MEIPDRIRQQLGDEELESAVNLGDEDLICFTPTRTLLYRGEGLISDDSLDIYEHNVERLDVSEGRRKTSFTLTYVDREERFTVSRGRTDAVLERLLAGVLDTADVIESEESIEGVFRFSELTLVITDKRIVKHIGTYLWDADYEEFAFANVTGLEFEEGSVATYIVIAVDGRPQRIKAPRSDAELVRRTLTAALFAYYDVETLTQLNEMIGASSPSDEQPSISSDIELDDSIAPLVTPDDGDDADSLITSEDDAIERLSTDSNEEEGETQATTQAAETADTTPSATDSDRETTTVHESNGDETTPRTETQQTVQSESAVNPDDIEAIKSRLATLTTVAKRQNKLLKQQQQTIDQLVEELKRKQ